MSENNAYARAFYILVHFFFRSLQNNNVKWSNYRFCGERKDRAVIFLSLFELKSCPYKFQLLDSPVTLDKLNRLETAAKSFK